MALADVVDVLACPHCGAGLALDERVLRCANGHSHDLAKQGYVSLLPAGARTGTADTAGMVAARTEFLAAGYYAGLANALRAAAGGVTSPMAGGLTSPVAGAVARGAAPVAGAVAGDVVVDVGAGTGYYLAQILDALPGATGVALDVSKVAVRQAAKAHERIGAVVADAWRQLPVRDGAADLVLNVFAPRSPAELRRILRPGGRLVVVTPRPDHLAELVTTLGLLTVDEKKDARLRDQLGGDFALLGAERHAERLALDAAAVRALVLMGPSAWHVDRAALDEAIAALPDPYPVTLSVTIWTFTPR